jgi:holin-like protein
MMLGALTVLLVYQAIGEMLVQFSGLPVPGPVIGMALLFVTLVLRGVAPAPLQDTAAQLLSHLSLLFVPAGVGVMLHFERLKDEGFAIAVTLIASTVITLAVTALALQALRRHAGPDA